MVFAGVGKQPWEVEAALEAGVLFFTMESAHEVSLLADAGSRRSAVVPVALRLNPDVDPDTHSYITTGRRGNKFGVDLDTASGLVEEIARNPHLALVGYHVHLGSQIRDHGPYSRALDRGSRRTNRDDPDSFGHNRRAARRGCPEQVRA